MHNNQPISEIIKNRESEEPKKKSREEWRKAKELEEARKAGTAPAAVDESGKDINPHIPQYISSAPWYFGARGHTLKHQRIQDEKKKEATSISTYYNRGEKGSTATKFRAGSCTNCGAMGHQRKDCFERPRKIGAQFTNEDIAADEQQLPDLALDFDGKRDRWNGFDASDFQATLDHYAKIEQAKHLLKEEKLVASGNKDENGENNEEEDADEEKYADNADMPGTKVDSKQRITVRNLRIREDTAKYLYNLNPNSAYYDPKTRSMRDDPFKDSTKNKEDMLFGGDSFVKFSGDTSKHVKAQMFAWQAYEKGMEVHLQADPTRAEVLHKEFATKNEKHKESAKESILEKYGGAEHLDAPPKQLIFAQTDNFVVYNRQGQVIGGEEKPTVRSKYEEDIFPNNHFSIWGSFWKDGEWGYHCCHSMVYNSYCTGVTGTEVNKSMCLRLPQQPSLSNDEQEEVELVVPKTLIEINKDLKPNKKHKREKKKKRKHSKKKASHKSDSSSSNSDEEIDSEEERKRKLKKALEKEDENNREGALQAKMDDRKRSYNSMFEAKEPTEEEREAYLMKRKRSEDPMADFV